MVKKKQNDKRKTGTWNREKREKCIGTDRLMVKRKGYEKQTRERNKTKRRKITKSKFISMKLKPKVKVKVKKKITKKRKRLQKERVLQGGCCWE